MDERISVYGFETNTGVKFVAVVDMRGRVVNTRADDVGDGGKGRAGGAGGGGVTAGMVGLREGEMKPVCWSRTVLIFSCFQGYLFRILRCCDANSAVVVSRCLGLCRLHMCGCYRTRSLILMSIRRPRGEEGRRLLVGGLRLIFKGLGKLGYRESLHYE